MESLSSSEMDDVCDKEVTEELVAEVYTDLVALLKSKPNNERFTLAEAQSAIRKKFANTIFWFKALLEPERESNICRLFADAMIPALDGEEDVLKEDVNVFIEAYFELVKEEYGRVVLDTGDAVIPGVLPAVRKILDQIEAATLPDEREDRLLARAIFNSFDLESTDGVSLRAIDVLAADIKYCVAASRGEFGTPFRAHIALGVFRSSAFKQSGIQSLLMMELPPEKMAMVSLLTGKVVLHELKRRFCNDALVDMFFEAFWDMTVMMGGRRVTLNVQRKALTQYSFLILPHRAIYWNANVPKLLVSIERGASVTSLMEQGKGFGELLKTSLPDAFQRISQDPGIQEALKEGGSLLTHKIPTNEKELRFCFMSSVFTAQRHGGHSELLNGLGVSFHDGSQFFNSILKGLATAEEEALLHKEWSRVLQLGESTEEDILGGLRAVLDGMASLTQGNENAKVEVAVEADDDESTAEMPQGAGVDVLTELSNVSLGDADVDAQIAQPDEKGAGGEDADLSMDT